jgi:hypothetical protein
MKPIRIAIVLAVLLGWILQVSVNMWLDYMCLPWEVHTFKWQCELNLPLLGFAFFLPGAVYGFVAKRAPWLGGFGVALLLLAIGIRYLSSWYGSDCAGDHRGRTTTNY